MTGNYGQLPEPQEKPSGEEKVSNLDRFDSLFQAEQASEVLRESERAAAVAQETQFKRYTGPNPFRSRTPMGFYEISKTIFFTVTLLAPLRCILCILLLLSMWPDILVASCGHKPDRPLGCIRRAATSIIRFKMRLTLFVLGVYYIPTYDRNPKGYKKTANIIVANHVSLLDAIPIFIRQQCSPAAKKEVFSIPFIGGLLRAFQAIPIDRTSAEGRRTAIKQLVDRCSNSELPPLLIFPEGTTSVDNVLTLFKPGPFIAGQPVQPVCIRFPNQYHDMLLKGSAASLYRLCCQFVNYMSYEYLPEYTPNAEEKANPQLFANNVRALMAKTMGILTTEHSFEDSLFLKKARFVGVPVDFELDPMGKIYTMKYADLIPLLHRFRALEADGQSVIDFEDFCTALNLNMNGELGVAAKGVFTLLDKDKDGVLNFGDFVLAIAVFSGKCTQEESGEALFAVCDLNGDGAVHRAEMERVIELAVTRKGTAKELPVESKSSKKKGGEEKKAAEPQVEQKTAPEEKQGDEVSDAPRLARLYSVKFEKGYKATLDDFFGPSESLSRAQFLERSAANPDVARKLLGLFLHKYVLPSHTTTTTTTTTAAAGTADAAPASATAATPPASTVSATSNEA